MDGQKLFDKMINDIKIFLENTPEDIFDFSVDLEHYLALHYEEMAKAQPAAVDILEEEVPDICAAGEPGMSKAEIEEFKRLLKTEYEKALKAVVQR